MTTIRDILSRDLSHEETPAGTRFMAVVKADVAELKADMVIVKTELIISSTGRTGRAGTVIR